MQFRFMSNMEQAKAIATIFYPKILHFSMNAKYFDTAHTGVFYVC